MVILTLFEMRKYIAFFLSIFALTVFSGCNNYEDLDLYGTITGQVSDKESGEPIQSAAITLSPGGLTTVSGSDGVFEYINLEPQQYTVTVQMDGYVTNRKSVTVIAGESLRADIPLTKLKTN